MNAAEILAALASRNLTLLDDGGRYWLRSGRAGFTVQDGEIVVLDRDGVPCTQDGSGRVADVGALVREMGRLEHADLPTWDEIDEDRAIAERDAQARREAAIAEAEREQREIDEMGEA